MRLSDLYDIREAYLNGTAGDARSRAADAFDDWAKPYLEEALLPLNRSRARQDVPSDTAGLD